MHLNTKEICKGLKNLVCSCIYIGVSWASGRVSMGEHIYNIGWKLPDFPDFPDLMGPSVAEEVGDKDLGPQGRGSRGSRGTWRRVIGRPPRWEDGHMELIVQACGEYGAADPRIARPLATPPLAAASPYSHTRW